ncbi:MAG: SDR family NAD(P)-dependent oxidoreductase [Jatrophihabitans sp.]|uniref:SDR family NAD(P)-dependent oxidoreductase n=1 Tax=Jatrophihabitans sp. TaxID=1932789 RepID=UPI003F81D153
MGSIAELLDLTGRVAVVTGGGMGIGEGIARRLAEAGATVVVADIDFPAAGRVAAELVAAGGRATAAKVDVASEWEIRQLLGEVDAEHGRLDILVNNAGIYPNVPIADLTEETFDRVMRVNLRSVFLFTKFAAELMRMTGGGRIVNITSIDALHPSMVGLAHYDASKHGVWGFTKNAALEFAKDGITVNAVAPGGITTPGTGAGSVDPAVLEAFTARIPLGRFGTPDEIGTVVLFLVSDMAAYMTGAQVVVDGGVLLA